MIVVWVMLLGGCWLCVFPCFVPFMYVNRRESSWGWARGGVCWSRPGTRAICWRQAIHPLHTHSTYVLLLALFYKFQYYLCYHFSSILWFRWEFPPPYQSHTSPQILPMYPPIALTSSHALESSHRTYSEEIWSYPIWTKFEYLGATFVPSMVGEKVW